jgi:hypothetical protein
MTFDDDDDFAGIEAPPLHDRTYRVRVFAESDDVMRIRGAVRDFKPAGAFIPEDPNPLQMHHMIVDLMVAFPSLEVVDAKVVLETHPHMQCKRIEDHYDKLVGLSIARGFTHKVRELFGGPRGCTHTTALLVAMAPTAIQATYSMRARQREAQPVGAPRAMTPEDREQMLRFNLDTCHVWASDGEFVTKVRAGQPVPVMLTLAKRLEALGRDPSEWPSGFGGAQDGA